MRVYDTNLTGASAAEAGRTQESQKTDRSQTDQKSSATAAGGGDRVEFSGALGQLSRALAAADQNRASRVQALAVQYQNGRYRPDSLATSRAMISEAAQAGL
ncbi:MAG TPA: flagellar biosynthesis anti-sigma factor FlgM [Candidatus Acidoferrales bacterium]|nr:flagellar biosynthesis anti-sigma factor FlgM [Candidatus Acidoferrales bacterium]